MIERETVVQLCVEFFTWRERQILQVHGVKLVQRRQREDQRLAVGGKFDLFEEARVIELLGARFHFAGVQARVRLQAGGGE